MMQSKNFNLENYENVITSLPDELFYKIVARRLNIVPKDTDKNKIYKVDREYWTVEYLRETLFDQLVATKLIIEHKGKKVTVRKYFNQAMVIWRWIPIAKPPMQFVINISDLTPRIIVELKTLDEWNFNYVTKLAVGQIFEAINAKYYRQRIVNRLKVEFDK